MKQEENWSNIGLLGFEMGVPSQIIFLFWYEDSVKCWSSATHDASRLLSPVETPFKAGPQHGPTDSSYCHVDPAASQLAPWSFGAYHTLHLDIQVMQLGSSYRQYSEACGEPSMAENQGAAARLPDKKPFILNLKQTLSSATICVLDTEVSLTMTSLS